MCAGRSKRALFGPKMTKHGRVADVRKWSTRVQNDQYNIFLTIMGHFGPIWTLLDLFRQNLIVCSKSLWPRSTFLFWGKKFLFCLKWSKRVQMGPKWSQMAKNMLYWSFWIILDPRRPLWDISNPAMFGHFWPKKGFFGPPCAHDWGKARAKTASN